MLTVGLMVVRVAARWWVKVATCCYGAIDGQSARVMEAGHGEVNGLQRGIHVIDDVATMLEMES